MDEKLDSWLECFNYQILRMKKKQSGKNWKGRREKEVEEEEEEGTVREVA